MFVALIKNALSFATKGKPCFFFHSFILCQTVNSECKVVVFFHRDFLSYPFLGLILQPSKANHAYLYSRLARRRLYCSFFKRHILSVWKRKCLLLWFIHSPVYTPFRSRQGVWDEMKRSFTLFSTCSPPSSPRTPASLHVALNARETTREPWVSRKILVWLFASGYALPILFFFSFSFFCSVFFLFLPDGCVSLVNRTSK